MWVLPQPTRLDECIWKHPKLVFAGRTGAGKTSLAVACLRRWAASAGRVAAFVHAYELAVARLQHPAGHGEPELVEHAMMLPMVLVDDIGSEREMAGNAVHDVVFARHAEDRALWVTTGLTRAQLVTRYGAGIVRRLLERARVIQVGRPKVKERIRKRRRRREVSFFEKACPISPLANAL